MVVYVAPSSRLTATSTKSPAPRLRHVMITSPLARNFSRPLGESSWISFAAERDACPVLPSKPRLTRPPSCVASGPDSPVG